MADVVYESVTEALVLAERRGRDRGGQNGAEGAVVRGPRTGTSNMCTAARRCHVLAGLKLLYIIRY